MQFFNMPPLDLEEVVMDVNNFDILLEHFFSVSKTRPCGDRVSNRERKNDYITIA